MITLDAIVAPHAVEQSPALRALVAAYDADVDVAPPVVVDFGHAAVALSGSHRLAAMREVYEGDADASALMLVVDAEALYDAVDDDGRATLDALAAGRVGDYAEAITALWPWLSEEARAALADQR